MKRFIGFLIICCLVGIADSFAQSRNLKRGYRQFYEFETSVTSWNVADNYYFDGSDGWRYENIHRKSFADVALTTSHGFQFNSRFFLGAGVTGGFSAIGDNWILGAFIHIRTDQTFGKYTPFADLRIGAESNPDGYFYVSPCIGYRFNFGYITNLNIGLGMSLKYSGKDRADTTSYLDNHGVLLHLVVGKPPVVKPYFTCRIGIDL